MKTTRHTLSLLLCIVTLCAMPLCSAHITEDTALEDAAALLNTTPENLVSSILSDLPWGPQAEVASFLSSKRQLALVRDFFAHRFALKKVIDLASEIGSLIVQCAPINNEMRAAYDASIGALLHAQDRCHGPTNLIPPPGRSGLGEPVPLRVIRNAQGQADKLVFSTPELPACALSQQRPYSLRFTASRVPGSELYPRFVLVKLEEVSYGPVQYISGWACHNYRVAKIRKARFDNGTITFH